MNSIKRITLISITAVLAAMAVGVSSASAGFAEYGSKKAANTSAKVRNAVTQAININGPRSEAAQSGRCLGQAVTRVINEDDSNVGQLNTMIYYGVIDASADTYRSIPGVMNWGRGVFEQSASYWSPGTLSQGLLGLRDMMLIGKGFPASDYCDVVAAWEANGYTGAKTLIDAEVGAGVYSETLDRVKAAERKISKARRVIIKNTGYGWGEKFESAPQTRIIGIYAIEFAKAIFAIEPEASSFKALLP